MRLTITLILARAPSPDCPVDRDALADLGDEFGGDDCEFVAAHRFDGAVVRCERIVEGDLESPAVSPNPLRVVVQSEIDAALGGGAHLFGELD